MAQEYVVRAPRENSKKFNVMRFANSLNVDVTNWKMARMERERTVKTERVVTEETPKFGLGSEFGKDAREEARRRKYGSLRSKKDLEDVPWLLKVASKNGKNRYKGTREGGVTENTSYYVFFQAHDGAFEAFPVNEWYNFMSIPKYKALTAEEAEEQFEKRDKILNHFAVMVEAKKRQGTGEGETSTSSENKLLKNIKREKEFKVTELDEWGNDSDKSSDDEDKSMEDGEKGKSKSKGKGKALARKKKKKKKDSDDDNDSEPLEESDEGDFDTREVDYMSDSSSSEDEVESKVNEEMKGVEDEDALRKLALSDDDDEEEEEDPNKPKDPSAPTKSTAEADQKITTLDPKAKKDKGNSDSESSVSEDSDDSDLDDSKFNSAMFMPRENSNKSKNGSDQSASSSRANTPMTEQASNDSKDSSETNSKIINSKRKMVGQTTSSPSNSIPNKRPRPNDNGNGDETISEEAVRRYLMRKPMTTTELLKKFKCKKVQLDKEESAKKIVEILKKLNPERQTIKGKLYLSVKPDQP